ncbi:diguanylate cyclase [Thioalkalivibrio sp. AKL8]|uniref:diguanylate cyclase n=1 Tax=Thioalkalivibrio sp. AKL8 TaxID=1158156 RepID=UPI000363E57D|nr:diguanylate cyclase [Thioalkalivibrio sp. AKL8]
MKILVVDHSRVFRALWSRMVLAAGHKPIMAASGAEGLVRIEEDDLELVCASITLPDMSGIEFCRQARAKSAGHDLPLILLTTKQDHDIRRAAFEAGATDLHDKTNIRDLFHQAARYGRPVEHAHEGHVLYVEDSPTVARVMTRILEGMGLEVAHFRSASAALNAFDEATWDLVLSDILVEGDISGMGLVSRLRHRFPDKTSLPIVAMSGLDDPNRRAELFRLGVNDFVTKPVLEDEVRARIGNLLANKRLLEEVQGQRQKLYDMAMIDPLTGLRNRNVLAECAARFFTEANQKDMALSLILLDIDHFKQINDSHGHLVGDEVLVGVGELLRTTGREVDVALRFGGEEFLLVLPECDLFDAHTRAEELRQQLRELQPAGLTITASFGVTSRPCGREVDMNDLFRVADQAVYQAKSEGRDCVVSRTLDAGAESDCKDIHTAADSPGPVQPTPEPSV